jgi:2-polyprenyl-3-methyl-5-hydroxy-6-metoxy-1,4-benzoquinol methylase
MRTDELVDRLVRFGEANSVPDLLAARGYLEALAERFGEREAPDVTAKELHAFHHGLDPLLTGMVTGGLRRKSQRWDAIYSSRARELLGCLPWESDRPVAALVELFDRDGFRPGRVLELGCGDGVNAVFMAGRGCAVTAVDVSSAALGLAREKEEAAGVQVEFVEADVLDLDPALRGYDFVFDRGLLHHLQVFQFEDYKEAVADRLLPGGVLHLIGHHVSSRPALVLDALYGSVGKLLGFLAGPLEETGCGFTEAELREIFSDRFSFESVELIDDDLSRPFRFVSAVMRRMV